MGEQHYDVIIIRAGFGGMGAAIEMKEPRYDNILIVDRRTTSADVARQPLPPVSRSTSRPPPTPTGSEPNPYWSRLFFRPARGDESYAEHVADKYDVRRHMRFNTTVEARSGTRTPRLAGRAEGTATRSARSS